MIETPPAGGMQDARLIETQVLVAKPKRFVRETLEMPDGYRCDWYYIDAPPSVMTVPLTAEGNLVFVRQYRHNLRSHQLEFPAGTVSENEQPEAAALRELKEETGYVLSEGAQIRPLGAYYSLPSETNKYTHVFLAEPVTAAGQASGDTEIERYFDMSVVLIPVSEALQSIGASITGMETIGALMAARAGLGGARRGADGAEGAG
jgi:8-oxo-dGTP pyrophosphatase MutT (NUDIX family)